MAFTPRQAVAWMRYGQMMNGLSNAELMQCQRLAWSDKKDFDKAIKDLTKDL